MSTSAPKTYSTFYPTVPATTCDGVTYLRMKELSEFFCRDMAAPIAAKMAAEFRAENPAVAKQFGSGPGRDAGYYIPEPALDIVRVYMTNFERRRRMERNLEAIQTWAKSNAKPAGPTTQWTIAVKTPIKRRIKDYARKHKMTFGDFLAAAIEVFEQQETTEIAAPAVAEPVKPAAEPERNKMGELADALAHRLVKPIIETMTELQGEMEIHFDKRFDAIEALLKAPKVPADFTFDPASLVSGRYETVVNPR